MKSYIIKSVLVIVETMLTFNCNDDFLNRTPLDAISN
jgi:hypothetical protein